jgi:formylmethanofuran dehydrogenase subunit E
MRVETPKSRMWSWADYDKGADFHGHGGPFLVVGLRMGYTALRLLDAHGWFDLQCKPRLKWAPPDSCILDGIQISTGCTTGKHNLDVEEGTGVSCLFTKGEKRLRIHLKHEVYSDIRAELNGEDEDHDEEEELNPDEHVKRLIAELASMSETELWDLDWEKI